MRAIVYKGPNDVSVETVPDPRIESPTDAIVRIEKGIAIGTGQTPVKRYNAYLRDMIVAGRAKPSFIVSHRLGLDDAPAAYEKFDSRTDGYTKVVLKPDAATSA